jgi:hypothetical protein
LVKVVSLSPLQRFAFNDDNNISITWFVIFDGILDKIEQNEFIKLPIGYHFGSRHQQLDQVNIVAPFESWLLEWPEHIENDFIDAFNGSGVHVQLVLSYFHPLDVVGIVVPYEFGCLLNASELLNDQLGLKGILHNNCNVIGVDSLDIPELFILFWSKPKLF